MRLKGLLKVCTGSDDLETCKGGKELVVNAKPRLYFQNNKLMMKLPHNVSVGNFETDFELALEKCQKGYCFALKGAKTQVKNNGIVGWFLKAFNVHGIVDDNFNAKFLTANQKISQTDLPFRVVGARVDPQNQRVEINIGL